MSVDTAGADESGCIRSFHHGLSAPEMSTDMSQVGVALFPSFLNISYVRIMTQS